MMGRWLLGGVVDALRPLDLGPAEAHGARAADGNERNGRLQDQAAAAQQAQQHLPMATSPIGWPISGPDRSKDSEASTSTRDAPPSARHRGGVAQDEDGDDAANTEVLDARRLWRHMLTCSGEHLHCALRSGAFFRLVDSLITANQPHAQQGAQ